MGMVELYSKCFGNISCDMCFVVCFGDIRFGYLVWWFEVLDVCL